MQEEQEELEEGSRCKEPPGHPVRRIGMAQGFGLLEYAHQRDPGRNLSCYFEDCPGRCLSDGVG